MHDAAHPHVSRFRVELFDVNAFGELSSVSLLRFLQQAASDASAALGFDVEWYESHGSAWLIRHTAVEVLELPLYRQEVAIWTWVSDLRRVRSQREYEVRREKDGRPLAHGFSDWVYVDLGRGAPIQPPPELSQALMPHGVVTRHRPPRDRSAPPPHAFATRRRVELADLDSVAHVNNARYAAYVEEDLWDALAAHGWEVDPRATQARLRPLGLELEYFDPALYRDEIDGRTWITHAAPDRFTSAHALLRADRRLLRAQYEWSWTGGVIPPRLRQALIALSGPS